MYIIKDDGTRIYTPSNKSRNGIGKAKAIINANGKAKAIINAIIRLANGKAIINANGKAIVNAIIRLANWLF